jgi:hypothetical protein
MKENDCDRAVEELIDTFGAFKFLCSVPRVCEEKAAYVAEGGSHGEPSPLMAKQWRSIAKSIDTVSNRAAGL